MSDVANLEAADVVVEKTSKSNDNFNVFEAWSEQRLPNGHIVMKIQHDNVVKVHETTHDYFNRRNVQHAHVHKTFAPAVIDEKRLQAVIDDKFKPKSFVDFKNHIIKAANVILPASSVLEQLLLKSLAGGDEQDQHLDYDKSCVGKCV